MINGTKIKVTLCISTYNWPSALKLCLASVLQQSVLPDEVLIGDDGSTAETEALIQKYIAKFPVPLIHVWQPDDGFRLAAIRNKSFDRATGDYIIQVDGDLILHKDFIKDHLFFAKRNTFVCGSRAMISIGASTKTEENGTIDWKYLMNNLVKKSKGLPNKFIAKLIYLFKRGSNQAKYVLGANMAFWKEDLLKVNGYDEDFTGWGKEDNDVAIRLCNAGIGIRFMKNAGIVYHLHHNEAPRGNLSENELKFQQSQQSKAFRIKNGITKVG